MQSIQAGGCHVSTFLRNLKLALRQLRRSPGFTSVAIVIMALGIGANTAIFSVVHAVLLEPLPFRDPQRLVQIWHVPPQSSFPGMTRFAVSARISFRCLVFNRSMGACFLLRKISPVRITR